jgi:Zn-dependent protease with chaperone function
MALSNKQLETLTWVLIYSGLLLLVLGMFVRRGGDDLLGWALVAGGAADAALGVVLLWWRSRRPE